ncbi:MAG: DEAD/DEAH box helicase [Thermodesulfobacteriota bacterium]
MSFTKFQFHPTIQAAVDSCGYTVPTPIQEQAIGPVLAGRDLLGLAQTGTGKTAAFVLPILARLMGSNAGRKRTRALIVAPTRELVEQIHQYIGKMAGETGLESIPIYGGVSKSGQARKTRAGVDIIVACPGRLLDLVNDGAVDLRMIEILVLDEADHMFDKGFLPDIRRIMKLVPRKRQTLVFSATMPAEIRHLAEEILTGPVTVQINPSRPVATITHLLYAVEQNAKITLLKKILQEKNPDSAIVFTRTKHKAKTLALQLEKAGCRSVALQGNMSQQKRQMALDGFKNGRYTILVATDIAARGIDVAGISHVINFDMPSTAETYTHRTGRTGRASRTGTALTFATSEDTRMISLIERALGKKMDRGVTPVCVCPPADDELEEKKARFSPEMPTRKKNTPTGAGSRSRSRRSSSTSVFGMNKSVR